MVTRRRILRGLGIGSGIVVAAPVTHRLIRGHEHLTSGPRPYGGAHRDTPAPASLDAEVVSFLGPIAPGASIDRWTVLDVRGVHLGAMAVVMQGETGGAFQVDVLRRQDAPAAAPIARTAQLEVWLSNRGDGATPTHEEHGLGAIALATALAKREAEGVSVPALLTHAERREQHPLGAYRV